MGSFSYDANRIWEPLHAALGEHTNTSTRFLRGFKSEVDRRIHVEHIKVYNNFKYHEVELENIYTDGIL